MCEEKLQRLKLLLKEYTKEDICLAFSGGIDSSLLLKLCSQFAKENGTNVYAVIFDTKLHPRMDIEIARRVANECNANFVVLPVDETKNPVILNNPVERCYYCKKYLFETLIAWARERNIRTILEGTNADDLKGYRPGIRAVRELLIKSPLMEAELCKKEIRAIAKNLNISVANRPSQPCMATRIPYNTKLDFSILRKLEEGEMFFKNIGFEVVRLRLHGEVLRIEIEIDKFVLFFHKRLDIINKMSELGFDYITLDAQGFRSGSLDIHMNKESQT